MNLSHLRTLKPQILTIAQQYGVSNIEVFSSVARGEADDASDVDLLIDMAQRHGLFDLMRFKRSIEELIGGKVDVVERSALIPAFRQRAEAEARPL